MKRLTLLVVVALMVFAAFASFSAVSADGNSSSIDIEGTVPNPCTGEDVYFSGTVHITQSYFEDENGGSHSIVVINYSDVLGTGVDTGRLYKYVGVASQSVYQDSDFAPLTSTVQQKIRWVTAGGQNDLTIDIFQHVTWDANGNVVTYTYDFGDYTCS
jgi:hypothetical protein